MWRHCYTKENNTIVTIVPVRDIPGEIFHSIMDFLSPDIAAQVALAFFGCERVLEVSSCCLTARLSVRLSFYLPSVCLSGRLSGRLSVCLFLCVHA